MESCKNIYLPVPASLFISKASPVHVWVRGASGDMELLCRRNEEFNRAEFDASFPVKRLVFVLATEQNALLDFMESHLGSIIESRSLRSEDKQNAVLRVAGRLLESLQSTPHEKALYERAKAWIYQLEKMSQLECLAFQDLLRRASFAEYEVRHAFNCAVLNLMIASRFDYLPEERCSIAMSGLLHDIGKTKIPRTLLEKPDVEEEQELMQLRAHAIMGYEIAIQHEELIGTEVALGIRGHHERWNGGGYPDNLRGERIHPYARITAVSDVFDAMTSSRPYSERMSDLEALRYICSDSGMFDPDYTHALLELSVLNA